MRGRPSRGLDKVLFVRCTQELLDRLDERRDDLEVASPGLVLSRADVARKLLLEELG